jgi:Holliday junction resolvase RusA-like endonuclease
MRWTKQQMLEHPKRDSLLGVNTKKQQQATEKEGVSAFIPPVYTPGPPQPASHLEPNPMPAIRWQRFTVMGPAMGKPRMTRRDVWKKRPSVVRYHEYCDRIRAAAGDLPSNIIAVIVNAHIMMPKSWSDKKRREARLMGQKPDWDNIAKAVCDALLEDDAKLAGGVCWKFWCESGQERTEITVLYLDGK